MISEIEKKTFWKIFMTETSGGGCSSSVFFLLFLFFKYCYCVCVWNIYFHFCYSYRALFPRGDDMVCIIDDREDVWNFAPNVVHVKPYCYFLNTGDINAPPFAMSNLNSAASNQQAETQNGTPVENQTVPQNTDNVKESCGDVNNSNDCKESTVSEQNITADSDTKTEKNLRKDSEPEVSNVCKSETTAESSSEKPEITENKPKETSHVKPPESRYVGHVTSNKPPPSDDYLLYLEEILNNIHKEYYKKHDKMKKAGKSSIPDLKVIVPEVKSRVLKGCNVVFSSVIPTNLIPETSRFWTLAESLGARVSLELVLTSSEDRTTHVVSSKLGTAKVNAAKRHEDIFIVGVDWLFCCAERWERADERLFQLTKDVSPPFLDGGKLFHSDVENSFYDPTMGKSLKGLLKKPSSGKRKRSLKKSKPEEEEEEKFSERIFVEAGLALSQDDIDDMDREIEEACEDSGEEENESNSSSETSEESLSSPEYPRGWKKPRRDVDNDAEENVAKDESSDADTIGSVDEEMAEAVKQEFGS